MLRIIIATAFVVVIGMIAPAVGQKAEIEMMNAKWIDFFNKEILRASRLFTPKTPLPFLPARR
jgi:hypothetical protein